MEPLKPRDKVTQHMTRDGLTLDNQTTGESVNVSSREAEQEYTTQPEGAAEKILERADELHDRHKARKAAKDAGKTVAQATGPVSRLQFTAEERASPELAPYIKKAEKRADKLEAAKEALPKKRVITKETVYDEAKGKAKSRLYFDKVEKAPPQLKPNPASRPIQEAGLYLHGKIHEIEHENVGVEGGHKGEELAERQVGRMIRSGVHRHKLKPYRAAAKAERKSIAANAEFAYQKSLRDNPELAQAVKNPVSRFWQKQHIKREYAKAARAAGQTAQGAAGTAKTTGAAAKKAAEKSRQAASFAARHWKGALIVGGVGLMLLLVMGGLQSCTAMFGSTGTGLAATSYLSEDSDMLGAEAAYAALEADLQHELDNYESLHPGYDEYRFDLDEIKHDPYVLTSILSALHNGVFTLGEVQGDLAMLFEKQYILTQTIETETRYRTETRTDSEGNTYTVEVPYTYYICNVKLENFDLSHLPIYILTEEQMGFYAAYMQTLGNRPDLFPNGSYVEGFVILTAADGSAPQIGMPLLAFLGDWTSAPILDRANWFDEPQDGENVMNNDCTLGVNVVGSTIRSAGEVVNFLNLGQNIFDTDIAAESKQTVFHQENFAISPDGSGYFDAIDDLELYQLRDAKLFVTEVRNKNTNELYFRTFNTYVPRSVYQAGYGVVLPMSLYYFTDAWDGTDLNGDVLPNGTQCVYSLWRG